MAENWKDQLDKSTRAVLVSVKNDTPYTLARDRTDVVNGVWKRIPNEHILPNSVSEFATVSSGFMIGTEASCNFLVRNYPTEKLVFSWSNPFVGYKAHDCKCSGNFKVDSTNTTRGQVYVVAFVVKCVNPLVGSPVGVRAVRDSSWRKSLQQESQKSVVVVIVNGTSRELFRTDYSVEAGKWSSLPPERIEPGEKVEFGTQSRAGIMVGTEGSVNYAVKGEKGGCKFYWTSPFMGENVFEVQCPGKIAVEKRAVKGAHAEVRFVLSENNPVGLPIREAVTPEVKRPSTGSHLPIHIFCLNAALTSISSESKEPTQRASRLVELIKSPKLSPSYDIVLLQEVCHQGARFKLVETLSSEFPHMIAKSGREMFSVSQESDLFFASKFPILWHQFRPFTQTIGPDTAIQKGMLAVLLDTSSIHPESALVVLNCHLQSNPDGSEAWSSIVDSMRRTAELQEMQADEIERFVSQIMEKANRKHRLTGLLVCGTFNVCAEDPRNESEQAQKILDKLPGIVEPLNQKQVCLATGQQLMALLEENGVPPSYLGALRAQLTALWPRSLVLVEMISMVIRNEIIRISKEKGISSEKDFMNIVLDQFNLVLGDNPQFWEEDIKIKIKSRFPTALTDKEESSSYDLRGANLSPFQLMKSLTYHTGIQLKRDTELYIVQHGKGTLTPSDIKSLNFYIDRESEVKVDGTELHPTAGYVKVLNILKGLSTKFPRDLFRERNKFTAGFTVDRNLNALVREDAKPQRLDFMFLFDNSPADDKQLLPLAAKECILVRTGSQPENQLSDHFGLEAQVVVKEEKRDEKL